MNASHPTPQPFEFAAHPATIPSPPPSEDVDIDDVLPPRLTALDELALGLHSVDLSSPEAAGAVEYLVSLGEE